MRQKTHENPGRAKRRLSNHTAAKTWSVTTGNGCDDVRLDCDNFCSATIVLGAGNDTLTVTHTTITQNVFFNGGPGYDTYNYANNTFPSNASHVKIINFEVQNQLL